MKRNPIKLIALALFGGLLGLPAVCSAKQAAHVKAEDDTKLVNCTAANIKAAIKNSYNNYKFTIDGLSFESKNLCYQGSSGSEYFQIKGNTSNGFWSTSTFDGYYISAVSMNVASNSGKIGFGSTSSISALSDLALGSFSSNYTEKDGYSYIKIMSAGSVVQIKNLKITFTKESGEPLPPLEGDYELVTDSATLTNGDKIVLGSAEKSVVAGTFGSYQYFSSQAGTFENGQMVSTNPNEITLLSTDGGWNLYTSDEGYIGCQESGKLAKGTKDLWSIAIDANGAATIDNGTYKIKYNVNSPRFSCYTGDPTDTMILPEIYKAKNSTLETFTVTYNGNGATGTTTDANTYSIGQEVTVLENAFDVVTGRVFKEWNTKADGSGTSYTPGSKLNIFKNIELFAIWEEEYIPVGDTFTKVTSTSALNDGDKFLFVFHNGQTVKVNGGLESSDHFAAYDATIVDDELSYTSEAVKPLTLVKEGTEYYIELNGSYLALTSNSSNKLAWKTKANANKWTITFGASGNAVVSSSISGVTHSIYYNGSGTGRFSNYSSSTMSPIELWAKSGHAKEVSLDKTSIDLNVEQTATLKVKECIGFTPSSYAWEITSGTEYVEITAGQGTNEITLTGLAEGEAEVYVTVDGVKAKATVNVHDYKYNILDKSSYFITVSGAMMKNDLSYVTDVDFDETNMWSFEKAYAGDNSYYLSSSEGYLSFSEDVVADGKNKSEIEITTNPVNVWTVTYSDGNGYKVATNTKTQGVRSLATHEETWYAFTGNNYVNLVEAGEFDHIDVKSLPTTKQYFVGDDLKPLNAHVYAIYTNGFEVEITNKIVWDKLVEGTKATGKVTIGGQERTVELNGIEVYKGDDSTFVVKGLEDNYAAGEKINKELLTVSITYKLVGKDDITKILTKDDYVVTPERIEEETTKVRISLAKDPTVYYEKTIKIKESKYVAANYVGVGDIVTFGTLGYDPYDINGGVELAYKDSKFTYSDFGYLPRGEMSFEVGKEGNYYTFKDTATGYYLKGDNSSFGFNMPDMKSIYDAGDGHYEFNMPVTISGNNYVVTMKTTLVPDFSLPNVFSSFDYLPGSYTDYIVGNSDLENNKFVFDLYKGGVYSEGIAEVNIASWKFENNVFQYALETSASLPEECLFKLSYNDMLEEWAVSSKPHQDKQLYFNEGGSKFGFYEVGSKYLPVMLFRDNDEPLQSTVTSLSVSFQEGMDVVSVGEQFPWTSSLIVKANYSGGASKVIPVGGYTIVEMPDTSVIGKATGKIAYGQNGQQIEKEFTITVKGNTQAFNVVCKDPILVGETYQAHLDDYEVPEDEPLIWSVSDPTLASIDQDGNVTGLAPGYVDVIATSFDGTYSDSEHIRIYQQVESVTLNVTSAEIDIGETVQLSATVLPANASNKNVSFSSSDDKIATVTSTGLITAIKPGTAVITCAAQNQPDVNFATCTITVKEPPVVHVTGISLDVTYKEVVEGSSFALTATVTPDNAANKSIEWSSSNPLVATVNNGVVTTLSSGECRIWAKTVDGEFKESCVVVVKSEEEIVHVTGVTLDKTSVTLDVDETATLVATVNPSDAFIKNVTWTSSDTSVATVSSSGVVTAKHPGSATITVKTEDGSFTASCTVKVNDINVSGLVIQNNHSGDIYVGDTLTLDAIVSPANASNKTVVWLTSNSNIATVNQDGVVLAKASGTVTITGVTVDGNYEASIEIQILEKQVDPKDNESKADELSTGAVVGIAVGSTAAAGGIGYGIFAVLKKTGKIKIRKRK